MTFEELKEEYKKDILIQEENINITKQVSVVTFIKNIKGEQNGRKTNTEATCT